MILSIIVNVQRPSHGERYCSYIAYGVGGILMTNYSVTEILYKDLKYILFEKYIVSEYFRGYYSATEEASI